MPICPIRAALCFSMPTSAYEEMLIDERTYARFKWALPTNTTQVRYMFTCLYSSDNNDAGLSSNGFASWQAVWGKIPPESESSFSR